MRNFAGFVQDRASYSRVTLNLGLRWSYYDGKIPAQTRRRRQVVPGDDYPEIDPGYNWNTLAPRTGVVFKLTEDGKNVAKASYSRYYESMYTSEYASINPNSIQTGGIQTWSFLGDLNGNGKADRNELGTLKSQFVARSNTIDPNLKDPKNDEIMFAFQRELANNWSLNVDWIQRWFRDETTDQNCYGLPCNTVASTAYSASRVVTDFGAGQHPRHRRRPLADLLRRAAGSSSARTRSSTPTAATTSPSTARSATRRPSSRSASGCRTAGRCRGRTCGRGSTARSRASAPTARGAHGLRLHQPEQPDRLRRSGPRRQRSAARLQAARQLPGAVGHQRRRQLPGAERPADRSHADRRAGAGLARASRSNRAAPTAPTSCKLLSLRADKGVRFSGHRASFVAELHNVLNSSAGQSSFGALTAELRQPGGVRRGAR